MGFLRRETPESSAGNGSAFGANNRHAVGGDGASVPIEELEQMIVEGLREVPISRERLELLQVGLPHLVQRELSDQAVIAGQTAARLGYLSRQAEFAMFDSELDDDDDLVQTLGDKLDAAEANGTSGWDVLAELAADMASAEPLDPAPQAGGPSWTLPGLSGDFRRRLRDNLVARMGTTDVPVADLRRTWKYGYFLGVLDELCED
jgi:hypothetical protein